MTSHDLCKVCSWKHTCASGPIGVPYGHQCRVDKGGGTMTQDQLNQVIIAQLLAMRASIDATLSLLVPPQPEPEQQEEDRECEHPPNVRQDLSTMGIERWQCKVCGYLHEKKLRGGE